MTCKKCGKRIPDGVQLCPRCGAPQGETVSLGAIRAAHAKKKPKLTRKQLTLRIVIIAVAALLALVLVGGTVAWGWLNSQIRRGSDLSGDLGINDYLPSSSDVQNIALFGLDNRSDATDGRSDAIIILSLDKVHNQIKMTSIARDTLVPVEGYHSYDGKTKITHAFAQGGVSLAVKTINQNFGMNIQDYVYVNFVEFMDIIDYIGGITINVESRELNELNNHIYYMEIECDRDIDRVKSAGEQTLSGGQALAYARIRKIDSDIERGNRQKEVLQAAFDKVKGLSLTKYPGLLSKVLGICHTNLTSSEIMGMATWAVSNSPDFINYSLPSEDCNAWGGNDGVHGWVWIYDLEYATALLHNFIYEEGMDPEVSRTTTYIKVNRTTTTTTTRPTTTTTTTAVVGPPTDPTETGDSTTDPSGWEDPTGDSTTGTDWPVDGPTGTDPTGEDTSTGTGEDSTTDDTGTGDTTESTGDTTGDDTTESDSTTDTTSDGGTQTTENTDSDIVA